MTDPEQFMDVNNSEFNVGFGSPFTVIPPSIGRIAAYYVTQRWEDDGAKLRYIEMNTTYCHEEEHL